MFYDELAKNNYSITFIRSYLEGKNKDDLENIILLFYIWFFWMVL